MTPKEVLGIKLFTLDEVSEMLGVQVVTLRKYIKNGDLRARKIGGSVWYVTEEAVQEFLRGEGPRKEEDK